MNSIRKSIKRYSLFTAVLILCSTFSLGTVAADSTQTTCTPPAPSSPGVNQPTGSSAPTYTYQCSGQYAGEWTNPYYVYDPSTDTYSPLYNPDYTYDCTSGVWYMEDWEYSPADGQFYEQQVVTTAPAGQSTDCPAPTPPPPSGDGSGTTGDDSGSGDTSGTSGTDSDAADSSGVANSGPSSTNTSGETDNNNVTDNNDNNLNVTQDVNGVATSGDASVADNTTGGDAASGAAQQEADIVNMLQSTSNALGSGTNVITFTDNINGDVNGNLLLDPSDLANIQNSGPSSLDNSNITLNNNVTDNNSTNADINNNINLASSTGNADVNSNTTGGNATSGNADNIVNVINSIDSAIAAGQSFIGTININGNLNGNILIPSNFVNELLADNVPTVTLTGPGSLNSSNTNVSDNTTVNNTNNEGINNNVTGEATSGSASVSGNTSGGSATSGNATTSITAFNLTGSQVIGANDLLVFVNVAGGNWVGLILNAPAGTTAAELGGGISNSGPNSTNGTNTNVSDNTTVNNTNNDQINNNINTSATSGNANVSDNTTGGNATSGNADNAVNLLNVENSSLNLSGWFGILFINVFGTWNGDLGTYTPTPPIVSNYSSNNPVSSSGSGGGEIPSVSKVFNFVPDSSAGINNAVSSSSSGSTNSSERLSSYIMPTSKLDPLSRSNLHPANTNKNYTIAIICISAFALYLVGDGLHTRHQRLSLKK